MSTPGPKNHPLEELLDLEEGSTPSDNPFERTNNALVEIDEDDEEIDMEEFYEKDTSVEDLIAKAPFEEFYDDIDKKNDRKFQEIYDVGMHAFSKQMQDAAIIEPKYRARNLEVAAQYLRIALDSAKDSGHQKANKDKVKLAEQKLTVEKHGKTNNIIVDRNELIKAMQEAEKKDPKVINADDDG